MRKIPFVVGRQYGRLVAVSDVGEGKWLMRCSCGTEKAVRVGALRAGTTKSCGCLNRDTQRKRMSESNTSHGMAHTPEYKCWKNIRNRCNNPAYSEFAYYGGRGIRVCPEWASFNQFYLDMGPRPSSGHSIERNDVDGDYQPSNCRWATPYEQNRNKRSNRFVNVNGRALCVTDAAKELQIPLSTFLNRLSK